MAGKVSMQEIADRLGVSKYTVSQALSGKPGVSAATRRRVAALARALGYRKTGRDAPGLHEEGQEAARTAGRRLLVGMEEHHADEPMFWRRVMEGVAAGCREHGLRPEFFSYSRGRTDEAAVAETVKRQGDAAGYVIIGKCPTATLLRLGDSGLPMVLVDHEEPLLAADAVLNANAEAGRLACRRLLAEGCRSIVMVGRDSFAVSFRERWWGCRMAFDEWQREDNREPASAPASLRKWTVPYGSPSWPHSLRKRLDTAAELPDGFVCANDELALELSRALIERGTPVPDRCRIVGIDNTAASQSAPLPLTTVDLAKEWLGMRAVEAIVRRLGRPEAPPEKMVLSASLIVRQSG
ncbi:substrate-binding domain-containing protein [Paenibacillus cisolokensis]|uniref:substrate-binding domain-containing protein n=1 Tax=Paenibacillus cisolokensis TaxID=1658519 RepID=UPI003D2BED9C